MVGLWETRLPGESLMCIKGLFRPRDSTPYPKKEMILTSGSVSRLEVEDGTINGKKEILK